MLESKGVYVTKQKLLDYNDQSYSSKRHEGRYRYVEERDHQRTSNVGCQCKHDTVIYGKPRNCHDVRHFCGYPKPTYINQESRSFSDIGLGSVKAIPRRRVKKIYLPETDDRGVGSSMLPSSINGKARNYEGGHYLDHINTSTKCVGGVSCCVNEMLSPIIHTRSGYTNPRYPNNKHSITTQLDNGYMRQDIITEAKERSNKDVLTTIIKENKRESTDRVPELKPRPVGVREKSMDREIKSIAYRYIPRDSKEIAFGLRDTQRMSDLKTSESGEDFIESIEYTTVSKEVYKPMESRDISIGSRYIRIESREELIESLYQPMANSNKTIESKYTGKDFGDNPTVTTEMIISLNEDPIHLSDKLVEPKGKRDSERKSLVLKEISITQRQPVEIRNVPLESRGLIRYSKLNSKDMNDHPTFSKDNPFKTNGSEVIHLSNGPRYANYELNNISEKNKYSNQPIGLKDNFVKSSSKSRNLREISIDSKDKVREFRKISKDSRFEKPRVNSKDMSDICDDPKCLSITYDEQSYFPKRTKYASKGNDFILTRSKEELVESDHLQFDDKVSSKLGQLKSREKSTDSRNKQSKHLDGNMKFKETLKLEKFNEINPIYKQIAQTDYNSEFRNSERCSIKTRIGSRCNLKQSREKCTDSNSIIVNSATTRELGNVLIELTKMPSDILSKPRESNQTPIETISILKEISLEPVDIQKETEAIRSKPTQVLEEIRTEVAAKQRESRNISKKSSKSKTTSKEIQRTLKHSSQKSREKPRESGDEPIVYNEISKQSNKKPKKMQYTSLELRNNLIESIHAPSMPRCKAVKSSDKLIHESKIQSIGTKKLTKELREKTMSICLDGTVLIEDSSQSEENSSVLISKKVSAINTNDFKNFEINKIDKIIDKNQTILDTTFPSKPNSKPPETVKKINNTVKIASDFSSDSLLEQVHNLEVAVDDGLSQPSFGSSRQKNNKEQEPTVKKSCTSLANDSKTYCVMPVSEKKSISTLKRHFEALRQSITKKDVKSSSSHPASSGKGIIISENLPSKTKTPDSNAKIKQPSEDNRVLGLFKLWGKKNNVYKETDNIGTKVAIQGRKTEPFTKSDDINEEEKKDKKKFFFFKKKSKEKDKEELNDENTRKRKRITACICEVKNGLMITVGENPPIPTAGRIRSDSSIEYGNVLSSEWLKKYIYVNSDQDRRKNAKLRWNNKTYRTSSSTVFELLNTVYETAGIGMNSKSDVATVTHNTCKKHYVNYVQDIQTWITNSSPEPTQPNPLHTSPESSDNSTENNIQITISNQKWFIEKSHALSRKIEVVLHSKNIVKVNKGVSSEFLRINIPKGFFLDSPSEDGKQSSEEQIYKIVEYESSDLKHDKQEAMIGDNGYKDIKVIISIERDENDKSLDLDIKAELSQTKIANNSAPMLCDVAGVGMIPRKDIRELEMPMFNIPHNLNSDNNSNEKIMISTGNQGKMAESYLQTIYKQWTPSSVVGRFWSCVSKSYSKGRSNDASKSCSHIDDNLNLSVLPIFDIRNTIVKSFDETIIKTINEDHLIRDFPKDSLEVFKKRKIYAASNKSDWAHKSSEKIPNCSSYINTIKQEDIKTRKSSINDAKTKIKHVTLPSYRTMEKVKCYRNNLRSDDILQFKETSSIGTQKSCYVCSKHANLDPNPIVPSDGIGSNRTCIMDDKKSFHLDDSPKSCRMATMMRTRRCRGCLGESLPFEGSLSSSCMVPCPQPLEMPSESYAIPPFLEPVQAYSTPTGAQPTFSSQTPKHFMYPNVDTESNSVKPVQYSQGCGPDRLGEFNCNSSLKGQQTVSYTQLEKKTPTLPGEKTSPSECSPPNTQLKSSGSSTIFRDQSKTCSSPKYTCDQPQPCFGSMPTCGHPKPRSPVLPSCAKSCLTYLPPCALLRACSSCSLPCNEPKPDPPPPKKKSRHASKPYLPYPPSPCAELIEVCSQTKVPTENLESRTSQTNLPCDFKISKCPPKPSTKPKTRFESPGPKLPNSQSTPPSAAPPKIFPESMSLPPTYQSPPPLPNCNELNEKLTTPPDYVPYSVEDRPPVEELNLPNFCQPEPKSYSIPTPKSCSKNGFCKKLCSLLSGSGNTTQDKLRNCKMDCINKQRMRRNDPMHDIQPCKREDCSTPKLSGVHLEQKASNERNVEVDPPNKSSGSITTLGSSGNAECIHLNSKEILTIRLRRASSSKDKPNPGMDIKLKDDHGNTIIERKNFVAEERPSLIGDMYRQSKINRVVTSNSITKMPDKVESQLKNKKSTSLENVIEVQVNLKLNNGDKTINIDPENQHVYETSDMKCHVSKTPQNVFLVKNGDKTNDVNKNDINVKVIVMNYKLKDKCKHTGVDNFTDKVSEHFNTVSTGYSDVMEHINDNIFSMHKATVDLNADETTKDEESNYGANGDNKREQNKEHLTEEAKVEKELSDKVDDKIISDEKTSTIDEDNKIDIQNQDEDEENNTTKLDEQFIELNTDNHCNILSYEITNKVDQRQEKAELLKKVLQRANPRNKEQEEQVRKMLKLVTKSEYSDVDLNIACLDELANTSTYESLKSNYFTESIINSDYSRTENLNKDRVTADVLYSTKDKYSREAFQMYQDESHSCLCRRFATKLDLCDVKNGNCSCNDMNTVRNIGETNCDIRTAEDLFLLNFNTKHGVEKGTTKLLSTKHQNDTSNTEDSINDHPSTIKVDLVVNTQIRESSSLVEIKASESDSVDSFCIPEGKVNEIAIKMMSLNSNILNDYKEVVEKLTTSTDTYNKDTRHFKLNKIMDSSNAKLLNHANTIHPEDILQSYEAKKAVLEIYAEKTVSDIGEHLVAKLPKYVNVMDSQITKTFKVIAQQ